MDKRAQYEFLPAVLEIQDRPPSPVGRAVIWSIAALFTAAVVWACAGKMDIVAVAQGHIVPSKRSKLIQPLEIGTVRAIRVQDGQRVAKGDVLIELDATNTAADETRIAQEYAAARAETARAGALAEALQGQGDPGADWPADIPAAVLETQRQLLSGRWAEYQARLAALDNQQGRYRAELAATDEQIEKLRATLPLIAERADALKKMADRRLAPRQEYLEKEQQRIEAGHDLAAQRQHRKEIVAAAEQNRQERRSYAAESLNKALTELADARRRSQDLRQENIKASQRTHLQSLIAPVAGVVQQLAVHTVGGVVTPAQQLLVIVPEEDKVEIEAVIENKDIGFVRAGQAAEVKVDAFPYTRYGTLAAELLSVSTDAVADEKRGLIFTSRVLLKQSAMRVEDKFIGLSPGMAVTVEVKTGRRRLISYLLSPLLQYASESARER